MSVRWKLATLQRHRWPRSAGGTTRWCQVRIQLGLEVWWLAVLAPRRPRQMQAKRGTVASQIEDGGHLQCAPYIGKGCVDPRTLAAGVQVVVRRSIGPSAYIVTCGVTSSSVLCGRGRGVALHACCAEVGN